MSMTRDQILAELVAGRITVEIASAALKALDKPEGKLSIKVSEKGAVSVYGLQRMPVTLYGGQWERLLEHADAIRAFLKDNAGKLATKGAAASKPAAGKQEHTPEELAKINANRAAIGLPLKK